MSDVLPRIVSVTHSGPVTITLPTVERVLMANGYYQPVPATPMFTWSGSDATFVSSEPMGPALDCAGQLLAVGQEVMISDRECQLFDLQMRFRYRIAKIESFQRRPTVRLLDHMAYLFYATSMRAVLPGGLANLVHRYRGE